MISVGVLAEVITVSSGGENKPVAGKDTDAGRTRNRRGENTLDDSKTVVE